MQIVVWLNRVRMESALAKFKIKITGLLTLFRFELPFFAGICVVVGEIMALGAMPPFKEAILGFISVFFISATALILNDYFDLETDRVNAPDRPLPSGKVTPNEVLILSALITIFGFISSSLLSIESLIVAIIVWIVGLLYNWRYKRTGLWGNLMVSFSVGMTFMYGAIAVGKPLEKLVWFFCIIAFLINLGEEIAADAMDMEGDQVVGSKSIAILYGRDRALKISAVIFGSVIVLSVVPFMFKWLSRIYFAPMLLMDVVILISTIRLLRKESTEKIADIRRIYISAGIAMIALIILRMVV